MNPAGFLDRILERKQEEIAVATAATPEREVRRQAETRSPGSHRLFGKRLAAPGPRGVNIIAEIKRASPSKGTLRRDLDPATYAAAYEIGGAAALSVLTDTHYFNGSPDDLRRAREVVSLPVLRKDFIISSYQIYETAAMGADVILLIVRALSEGFLRDALVLSLELGLEALVEVHSETELETATRAGARVVGINNRDLTSFKTDIRNSIRIGKHLEKGQIAVAESGIRNRDDMALLCRAGIHNFLIGESLVRADDPITQLGHLLGNALRPNGKADGARP